MRRSILRASFLGLLEERLGLNRLEAGTRMRELARLPLFIVDHPPQNPIKLISFV
jgi:hypothetical protein